MMRLKNAWNTWKSAWAELTARQRKIAVCVLLAYIAMIGITIITAPYSSRSMPNDWMFQGMG
jgi:hypothetical protein